MGQAINPVLDADVERVKEQLATAAALRKQGMEGNGGAGYHGGRVFAVGNRLGDIAQMVAGQLLGNQAREQQAGIEQRQAQERQDWLGQMPQATESMDIQQSSPEQMLGPTQDAVVPTEVHKSPRALQQAMTSWAVKAPRGMEGVQNYALQQTMDAPRREAEAQQRAADRLQELQIKAMENRATQQERLAWQEQQNATYKRTADQQTAHLVAALAARGGGSTTADLDRQLKELRIKALEGRLDAPKQLPVGAQTHQRSLQNLESGLAAYEALLKSYDPQSKDVGTDEKRAAIKSAFTDLQMNLKGAYELGAITGPDMEILQGAITDPTSVWGMTRGAVSGRKAFEAQISQAKAGLNRSKRNFEQQYGVTLPEPAGQVQAPMPGTAAPEGFKILGVRDK